MKELMIAVALTLAAFSFNVQAADSADCVYGDNGGYSSHPCHKLNEERLDALEAKVDSGEFDGEDGLNGTDGVDGVRGYTGEAGTNGVDGINGIDGVAGTQGVKGDQGLSGTNGLNGTNGVNGVDGQDGVADQSVLDSLYGGIDRNAVGMSSLNTELSDTQAMINAALEEIREQEHGIAESAAFSMLAQSPHGQNGLSLGCAEYRDATECAIGATVYLDEQNLMFKLAVSDNTKGASVSYHFGH